MWLVAWGAAALLASCSGASARHGSEGDGGGGAQGGGAQGAQGGVGISGTGLGATGNIGSGPTCVETDVGLSSTDPNGYGVEGTATGSNGTFTDSCEDGLLSEYRCNNNMICSQAGCMWDSTASAYVVECPIGCSENACPTWCPLANDTLDVLEVTNGVVTMRHQNGLEFECTLVMAYEEAYDCIAPSLVGHTFVATGAGECTPVFGIQLYDSALGTPAQCYFSCAPI